jgi:two-component system, NarL family, invasion response regulator UvrY
VGEMPRCLVVEPQPLVRLGMRRVLDPGYEIEELSSRSEAVELVQSVGGFEVVVIDIRSRAAGSPDRLPGSDAVRTMRTVEPALGIVAHGDRAERYLATQAFTAGASAYVSRGAGPNELRDAVSAAVEQERFVDPAVPQRGHHGRLTRRQRQILQLLADGGSTTVAAEELQVSEETVRTHTKNLLARLEARNRAHAVAIGLRESLIE